jgi:hypothetical protein
MLLDILKGLIIGICASAPLGPIAVLVLQKSFSEGHRAGFITGLGATLVDTVYAIIAIFALALAEKFIYENTVYILIVGGIVVILMGLSMTFKDPLRKLEGNSGYSYSIKDFLQAIFMGISNPGAILVILTLFTFFNIEVQEHNFSIAPVILSLSLGSGVYWFFFSWLFSHLGKKIKLSTLLWINRISGIIVLILGIVLLADGLMKVISVWLPVMYR